jgi:hypothetical protein
VEIETAQTEETRVEQIEPKAIPSLSSGQKGARIRCGVQLIYWALELERQLRELTGQWDNLAQRLVREEASTYSAEELRWETESLSLQVRGAARRNREVVRDAGRFLEQMDARELSLAA